MTKKLHSILMLSVSFCFATQAGAETFNDGDFLFETLSENTVAVSAIKEDLSKEEYTIPATCRDFVGKEYKVVAIADKGFERQKKIKKFTLGENVTKIGEFAFRGCTSLENVYNTSQVTELGQYAFGNCKSLLTIDFARVEKINERAFYECNSLQWVNMPSVTYIERFAFENCHALSETTFSDDLYWLGNNAFCFCISLRSFYIPVNCTVCESVFYNAQRLETVVLPYKMNYMAVNVFEGCNKLTRPFILCDEYPEYTRNYKDGLLEKVENRLIYCAPALESYLKENTQNGVINLNTIMTPTYTKSDGDGFTFTLTPAHIPATSISDPLYVVDPVTMASVKANADGEYTVSGDKALISWNFDGTPLTYYIHKPTASSAVENVEAYAVSEVYTLEGIKVATLDTEADNVSDQLRGNVNPGIYVIKSGNKTRKAIIF